MQTYSIRRFSLVPTIPVLQNLIFTLFLIFIVLRENLAQIIRRFHVDFDQAFKTNLAVRCDDCSVYMKMHNAFYKDVILNYCQRII